MQIDINGFKTDVSTNGVGTPSTTGLIHNYSSCCKASAGKQDFCKECGKEVPKEEVLKGVELVKGEPAIFSQEEIKSLKGTAEAGSVLKIDGSIPANQLSNYEPLKSYWLSPKKDKSNKKRYGMILAGLARSPAPAENYALVGKVILRDNEYWGAIYEQGGKVRFTTFLYVDDQRTNKIDYVEAEQVEGEKMRQLFASIPPAQPEAYENQYAERLVEAVEARLEGRVIEIMPEAVSVGNEMEDLERALLVAKVGV